MAKIRTRRRPVLRARARAMRSADTEAEARLWNCLRAHRLGGWKWRRQVPKGPYILDFLCDQGGLVLEVDGGQHSEQAEYDARRTAYLAGCGLRVLRFWNSDVLSNRAGVCMTILGALGGDRPGWDPFGPGGIGSGTEGAAPPLS